MFKMTLVTPEKRIATDLDVEEVVVPAYRGHLDILPGHAPLMTTLDTGVLKYREAGKSEFQSAVISWGYCEVNPLGVNILAETAEAPESIDKARAEKALKLSKEQLTSSDLSLEEIAKYQRKLKRAHARLEV
jgi:F-type H+-transporting ATPase subunit epsilon